jgi:hypothetical protein
MSGEEERSEELKGLEAALAALAPRVEGFDRERLIFEAGRAAAMAEMGLAPKAHGLQPVGVEAAEAPPPCPPRRRWAWPAAFSAMTAVAAMLLVMLIARPKPQMAERTAEPPASVPAAEDVSPATRPVETPPQVSSIVYDRRLRQRALMHGIDLWAEPSIPRASGIQMAKAPTSMLQLERELIKESLHRLGDRT